MATPTETPPGPVHASVPLAEAMERIAGRIESAKAAGVPQDDAKPDEWSDSTPPRDKALAAVLEAS